MLSKLPSSRALLLVALAWWISAAGAISSDDLTEPLRARLERSFDGSELTIGTERVHTRATTQRFYERTGYRTVWTRQKGVQPAAKALIREIENISADGLEPTDYHLEQLTALADKIAQKSAVADLVEFEIGATDAFFLMATHLRSGVVDAVSLDPEWIASPRDVDLVPLLERMLHSGRVPRLLDEMRPAQPGYAALKEALAELREILEEDGEWPTIPEGDKLELGMRGPRVLALRARLQAEGSDLDSSVDSFDDDVFEAVRGFQARYGLEPDGVVGPATLREMNRSIQQRIDQLLVNLERWRWLPASLGQRHVLVNIAAYDLQLVDRGEVELAMRVVVGRNYRRTPVFSDQISYMVFNPHWEVPPSIATKDILPAVKKDRGYLARMGFTVLQGSTPLDPATIDWDSLRVGRPLPFRFRQAPGARNALGQVKFMFPNKFNVYLHDTPAKELFEKTERAFSSGCIRVQKPVELIAALLRGDSSWTREAVDRALASGQERTVRIPTPVPVHLLYWTATVDPDGEVRFYPDVYSRDDAVLTAMRRPPPDLERGALR